MSGLLTPKETRAILKIVGVYFFIGALWIYLSDTILGLTVGGSEIITRYAVIKGWMYVFLTSLLLYLLIRKYAHTMAESQRQLAESEKTLKSLMNIMPVGVVWFDKDGKVEYINQSFIDQFGFDQSDISTVSDWISRSYRDQEKHSEFQESQRTDGKKDVQGQKPLYGVDSTITCKDGSVRHVIVNTQYVSGRTLIIYTDITEREAIQNELLKTQKLELLSLLAGGIAHDFNNILTTVLGNISFAQMFLAHADPAFKPLVEAEKGAQRATELAHQLLTFTKGTKPITKKVSIKDVLNESVSFVLRGSNVQFVSEIKDDLFAVEADEGQISQVFNNIIINAVQAMPHGGKLVVRAENTKISQTSGVAVEPGDYVSIRFIDEGCGISEENQKKIFDPYFTTKATGSGLGLASVLSIVKQHGGNVFVESVVGKGTTISIFLPSTGELYLSNEGTGEGQPCDSSKDGKVLVMDDEEAIRTLVTQILVHHGYKVEVCSDGDEAMRLYKAAKEKEEPFLAVIMDLTIPGGMGGKEAAQLIHELDPNAKLIVSSGYSNDPILAEYKAYGFCAAVAKPYRASLLVETLNSLNRSSI